MPVLSQRNNSGVYFSIIFVFLGYFVAIGLNYQEKNHSRKTGGDVEQELF